jgi:hypothetical protein
MKPVVPKPQRCAIYTRKSTEHNLDLEFNSLDAQREACGDSPQWGNKTPETGLPGWGTWIRTKLTESDGVFGRSACPSWG